MRRDSQSKTIRGFYAAASECQPRATAAGQSRKVPAAADGFIAGVGAQILPRLVPMGAAVDMLLTADRLSAEDAYRLGLVQKLVEPGALMEAAFEKAEMIAANSQTAVRGTKKILKFWRDVMLAEQQNLYEAVVHRVLLSGDVHEGPRAFAEKRAPKFKNRWPKL